MDDKIIEQEEKFLATKLVDLLRAQSLQKFEEKLVASGVDINTLKVNGEPLVHWTLRSHSDTKCMDVLLKNGADLYAEGAGGKTVFSVLEQLNSGTRKDMFENYIFDKVIEKRQAQSLGQKFGEVVGTSEPIALDGRKPVFIHQRQPTPATTKPPKV